MSKEQNVVEFPDLGERSWRTVAQALGSVLKEAGHDPAAVDRVIAELKPEYLAARNGPVTSSNDRPDDVVAQVNQWVTSFLLRLLKVAAEAKLEAIAIRAQ